MWPIRCVVSTLALQRFGERKLSPSLPDWLRQEVLERQGYTCVWSMVYGPPQTLPQYAHGDWAFEVEHVVPYSCDGSDDVSNLRASCPWHNRKRSNQSVATFKARIQADPELQECGYWECDDDDDYYDGSGFDY